jgi:hypothetical protein
MPRTRSADIREFGNISRLSSSSSSSSSTSSSQESQPTQAWLACRFFLNCTYFSLSELGHVTNSCNQCIQHGHVNDCSLAFDVFFLSGIPPQARNWEIGHVHAKDGFITSRSSSSAQLQVFRDSERKEVGWFGLVRRKGDRWTGMI